MLVDEFLLCEAITNCLQEELGHYLETQLLENTVEDEFCNEQNGDAADEIAQEDWEKHIEKTVESVNAMTYVDRQVMSLNTGVIVKVENAEYSFECARYT